MRNQLKILAASLLLLLTLASCAGRNVGGAKRPNQVTRLEHHNEAQVIIINNKNCQVIFRFIYLPVTRNNAFFKDVKIKPLDTIYVWMNFGKYLINHYDEDNKYQMGHSRPKKITIAQKTVLEIAKK